MHTNPSAVKRSRTETPEEISRPPGRALHRLTAACATVTMRWADNTVGGRHTVIQAGKAAMANTLYYGDNLDILRDRIATASVDLVYLDPPFNSNRNYNVLFKNESGVES